MPAEMHRVEHTLALLLQLIGSHAPNPGPAGIRQQSEGSAGISGPYAALMAAASEALLVVGAPPGGSSRDALQGEDTTGLLLLLNVSAVAAFLWAASLADAATASGAAAGEEGAASARAWGRFWEQVRAAGQLWGQLVSQRTAAVGGMESGVPLLRHVGICQEALTRLHQLCYLHGVRAGLCCLRPAHKASLTLSLLISHCHF